jgi:hypothetical protein
MDLKTRPTFENISGSNGLLARHWSRNKPNLRRIQMHLANIQTLGKLESKNHQNLMQIKISDWGILGYSNALTKVGDI